MKIRLIIYCSLLVIAIGWVGILKTTTKSIHPDFQISLELIRVLSNNYISNDYMKTLSIQYGKFEPSKNGDRTLGMAYIFTNKIIINQDAWGQLSELERVVLLWHEIKHVQCYMGHEEGYYSSLGVCPLSIMNPYLPNDYCIRVHFFDYIKNAQGCKFPFSWLITDAKMK